MQKSLDCQRGIVTKYFKYLDNWAVFQELWDGILDGRVDSEFLCQVICVQKQMQSFNFFFGIQTESFNFNA